MTTELKVAVMIYGQEDLSAQLNEWETFVESHSKFDIVADIIREPELTNIPKWNDCYFIAGWNVDRSKIPTYAHIVTLLWKLLEGQSTCWGGGTWGGDYGIHGRPVTSIPYNVSWWNNPCIQDHTYQGFETTGAQIITHEFQNALRWIILTELGFPAGSLPDPYAGDCAGMTLAECYISIFNAITDDMYSAIDSIFRKVTLESVPADTTVTIVD